MAFDISNRFKAQPKSFRLLEPGAYQNINSIKIRPNKVPFLSKSSRNTQPGTKLWTNAIYLADTTSKIPNCTSISSKIPRFPYDKFNSDDIEILLCRCGMHKKCECPFEEEEAEQQQETTCQARVPRKIFKGPTPKSAIVGGLSAPSKWDHGFNLLPNGKKIRMFERPKQQSPPFYDATIKESTAFYKGCKWSKRTSLRTQKPNTFMPGPAEYNIEGNEPRYEVICAAKVRAHRRKTSKQLRFIEMVQRQNILNALPGPASYSPLLQKGTDLKYLGPKADRFFVHKFDKSPAPTTYWVKRDFDKNLSISKSCRAKLPPPACFGVKDKRFKYKSGTGPSPASYNTNYIPCQFMRCSSAPFGSFSKRFKDCKEDINSDDDDFIKDIAMEQADKEHIPTWEFKSQSVRLKPLVKKKDEPSPADMPQPRIKKERLLQYQYNCPFFSSEERLQPWFNWIPVQGKEITPGPAYYNYEKPSCPPAVHWGPLCRSQRFSSRRLQTPSPNAYKVSNGIENILVTYNERLRNNIKNKHKFYWKPPVEPRKLTLDERESLLINKSIALLDEPDIFEYNQFMHKRKPPLPIDTRTTPSKLLRCFLYAKQIQPYF